VNKIRCVTTVTHYLTPMQNVLHKSFIWLTSPVISRRPQTNYDKFFYCDMLGKLHKRKFAIVATWEHSSGVNL